MTAVASILAVAIVFALGLSLLVFQAITGVPPMSSSSSEAADVISLLKQAGLAEQAIVYELGCGWGSLVIALARAFPDTGICLNHVGGPLAIGSYAGKRDDVFATWSKSIRELATCRNVVVKVGGMAMRINGWDFHEKADPPSSEALAAAWKPYVETCIEAFGASRCMFESNFPVDKGSYGYGSFWNAGKLLAKGASASDKTDLFSGTAARFYRLDLGPG